MWGQTRTPFLEGGLISGFARGSLLTVTDLVRGG